MSLDIIVTWGTGYGPTKLSAFDDALCDAGIGNFNILCLSSVIPSNARIEVRKYEPNPAEYGYRLYGVLAQHTPNYSNHVWAGLGWVTNNKTGQGVFVECAGNSEYSVRRSIELSLEAMRLRRPDLDSRVNSKIVGVANQVHKQTVSIVVCAVYKTELWE